MILLQTLVTFSLLVAAAHAADPIKNESIKSDPAIQKILRDLERAFQDRDFSQFDRGQPEEKPIRWGLCGFDRGDPIPFDAAVHRLSKASEKATITVSETPLQAYFIVIETQGWLGENQYRFFLFEATGDRWRWIGIEECDESVASRTEKYDFIGPVTQPSVAMDDPETPTVQNLVDRLKEIFANRNFMLLRPYVPNKKVYGWTYCGPGDSGIDEYYFDGMQKKLLEYLGGAIYINPDLDLSQGMDSLSIETEGWLGEYPFFLFYFDLNKTENRWELGGVCYSRWPELHKTQGGEYYKETYSRKPDLPRPGARVFNDVEAFHVRLREIINQKVFEALKPYAIRRKLINVTCDAYMTNNNPRGSEIDIDEAIQRLNNNINPLIEIKLLGAYGANRYLASTGWSLDPYIYFGFSETPDGWEWTKIAFCKDDLFMRPPSENTGPHKPLMQHRLIQAAVATGVIVLISGLWFAYRHERRRQSAIAMAGGGEAIAPMAKAPMKRTMSSVIGIIMIVGLVVGSIWSFNKALTLEESAGASPAEIERYQLIQKISLAGILAVLAGLIVINRKEMKERPTTRDQVPAPNERLQNFLGPAWGIRRRFLLTMVPGLGQAAAGRKARAVLTLLAIPSLWAVLYFVYMDMESQFFSFPMVPVISALATAAVALTAAVWVWIAVDSIRLNETGKESRTVKRLIWVRRSVLALIPVAAGILADLLFGDFDPAKTPLMFGWGGAGAGLLGGVAWSMEFGSKKVILAISAGFIMGLVSRFVSFALPLPVGEILLYRPLVGGLLVGFFVLIAFLRWKISPLVVPAAMAWAWIGSIVDMFLPSFELSDATAPWIASIVYHGPTLFEFYWIGLAILWIVDALNRRDQVVPKGIEAVEAENRGKKQIENSENK